MHNKYIYSLFVRYRLVFVFSIRIGRRKIPTYSPTYRYTLHKCKRIKCGENSLTISTSSASNCACGWRRRLFDTHYTQPAYRAASMSVNSDNILKLLSTLHILKLRFCEPFIVLLLWAHSCILFLLIFIKQRVLWRKIKISIEELLCLITSYILVRCLKPNQTLSKMFGSAF